MIIRRDRAINPEHTEVSLPLSYNATDINFFMKLFCQGSGKMVDVAKKLSVLREQEIRSWAERHVCVFGNYHDHWRVQLSGWFMRQAIKQGYFIQSVADPTSFYFGTEGMRIMAPIVKKWDETESQDEPALIT